mgnify:CR=1 FL=1
MRKTNQNEAAKLLRLGLQFFAEGDGGAGSGEWRGTGNAGVLSFLRKRKEPKENLFGEKLRFSKKGGVVGWSAKQGTGLHRAGTLMGCMKRALRRVEVLRFSRSLSDGEKWSGEAHLKPSPGRGRGTVEDG